MGNSEEDRAKERGEILENIKNTVNSHQSECKTGEDLGKEIDKGLTNDIQNYINKYKSNQNYYNDAKDKFIKDFDNAKKIEELTARLRQSPSVEYVYRESEESRRIREQNELENRNRREASEKLIGCLNIVRNDFSTKLKDKILAVNDDIEKELSNFSSDNLKIFLLKLAENENLKGKIIENIKNESEILLEMSFKNSKHFNILLLGKTGVGKSTLINGTFDFNENEKAETGIGQPITQKFEEFTSEKRKGLRLIDSKGIEMGANNINFVFNESKNLIEHKARQGDPDKLIHCIWYCFQCGSLRFEPIEKETLILLMNQYYDNKLPIIIVITQSFDEGPTNEMAEFIKKEFQFLNREMIIMPVVAEKKTMVNKKNVMVIEKDGIEDLLKISFEKSQNAVLPALFKSIEEKIIQAFLKNLENRKIKLKNDLNQIYPKVLRRIKEEDNINNSISKLTPIIKKTLNIFIEIEKVNDNMEDIDNVENQEIKEPEEKKEEAKENVDNIENQNEEKKEQKDEDNNLKAENDENKENNEIQHPEEEENSEEINNEEQNQNPEENNQQNEVEEQEQIENHEQNQEEGQNENEIIEDDINNANIDEIEITEESKNEINLFLDDLCKWFIGRLTSIISDLVKVNSNELGLLLFNEQEKVKNDHNVKTSLSNEKPINSYFIESEQELKTSITKKVYFLALKKIFKIISENLVDVSGKIIKEQFDSILPGLKNYISEDKLKKRSDEVLEEILKNKEI